MTSFVYHVIASTLRWIAALSVVGAMLASLSCGGGGLQLTRIAVLPQNITVAGTPTIIYTAIGHYKNSQTTQDITGQVVWKTSAPSIADFSDPTHPNYLIPTGSGCGANIGVTASVYQNSQNPSSGPAVVGPATINIQCGTGSGIDFGLSSNPTSVTASAGSQATYTISVLIKSGNPTVDLQVTSGLPAGATASFNPPSVTGTSFSTLTISIAAGTAPTTYHPKVTGTDASGSLSLTVNLTVT
jgi:hypothetical protein